MNRKYLVAIAVAAVVVIGLIIIIPLLTGGGDDTAAVPSGDTSVQAPPLAPGATMPPGHPAVGGDTGQPGDTTGTTVSLDAFVASAEAAYKANPKDMKALLALGDAYIQANRPDDAAKIFQEALALEPDNSDARAGVAMVALVKGDTAKAQSDLEAIIKDDPNSQSAHYNLAIIFFSANQKDKAKAEWEKALAIDSGSELGKMSEQFLALMSSSGGSGQNPHGGTSTTQAGGATTPTTTP